MLDGQTRPKAHRPQARGNGAAARTPEAWPEYPEKAGRPEGARCYVAASHWLRPRPRMQCSEACPAPLWRCGRCFLLARRPRPPKAPPTHQFRPLIPQLSCGLQKGYQREELNTWGQIFLKGGFTSHFPLALDTSRVTEVNLV